MTRSSRLGGATRHVVLLCGWLRSSALLVTNAGEFGDITSSDPTQALRCESHPHARMRQARGQGDPTSTYTVPSHPTRSKGPIGRFKVSLVKMLQFLCARVAHPLKGMLHK